MQPQGVYREWVQKINEEGRDLTGFEVAFMDSVTEYVERGGMPSDKQAKLIERIYVERVP